MFLIFFVIGPLLTLLILVGIFLRKLPFNVDEYERTAMLSTGLRWKIGSVEYRKSNQIRFKNVRLFRSNSDKPLFAASEVDLIYMSGSLTKEERNKLFPNAIDSQTNHNKISDKTLNNSGNFFGSVKRFLGVADRGDGFWYISFAKSLFDLGGDDDTNCEAELRECFLELISQMEELSSKPISVKFDEIDVVATSLRRFKLRFVVGNLYQTESTIRSEWSFFIPIVSETEREQVLVVRQHNSRNLSVTLKTGNMPLPCELITIFCPPFQFLGQYPSRVCGEIMVSASQIDGKGNEAVWTYSLRNVFFNDINISKIADGNIPYKLSGKIQGLRVNEAFLGGGKLQANGWIDVVDGVVERELFHRLIKLFSLTINPSTLLDSPRAEYPFTRCTFDYELQHDGVIFFLKRPSELTGNMFMLKESDGVQTSPMQVSFPNGNAKLVSYHNLLSIFASDATPIVPLNPLSKFFVPIIPDDEIKKQTPQHQKTTINETPKNVLFMP
ncbi:MAG: hypothetical protein LBJ00_03715 [Planctomycetaceae bacterium]|nr:hypothetical protein [Planctomycetaceae bacterium]